MRYDIREYYRGKNALTTKMILFHVSIAVLWLTEICRRIVACRCIAKGDTHSHLMNINKIENSALNTNFKASERKKNQRRFE